MRMGLHPLVLALLCELSSMSFILDLSSLIIFYAIIYFHHPSSFVSCYQAYFMILSSWELILELTPPLQLSNNGYFGVGK